ncbi:MAG: Maf family protein [Xanthomonadales bacterium]
MQLQSHKTPLILASVSPYRRELLERLGLPFETADSNVDETPGPDEDPVHLVQRLARAKADAVARRHETAVVIGSDQVAVCGSDIVGKPGDAERARAQLRLFSGRSVHFLTAFAVFERPGDRLLEGRVDTECVFRTLSDAEIDRYLELDRPYDCAGSFKSERAGLALLDRMSSDDPTALIGLPLIALAAALRKLGFRAP